MAHESKVARLRDLVEQVGNTGMFDAGREDELGEITDLVRQLDAAGALEQRTAFVQVVDVVDRQDGTYVFEDLDDAKAFEAVVNAQSGVNLAHKSACYRTEQVVCAHADALKLIAAECEASAEAEAASLESGVPVATHAWKKGEDAPYPDKLEAIRYVVYPTDLDKFGQRILRTAGPRREIVLWVGLDKRRRPLLRRVPPQGAAARRGSRGAHGRVGARLREALHVAHGGRRCPGPRTAASAWDRTMSDEKFASEFELRKFQTTEYQAWQAVVAEMRRSGVGDINRGGVHERLHNAIAAWGEELAQLRMNDPDPAHATNALAERRQKYLGAS